MKHLISTINNHYTFCKLIPPDAVMSKESRDLLVGRLSFKDLPAEDSVTTDPAETDCKKCMDEKIVNDDHKRWNMQFFKTDDTGYVDVARTGFVEPEPINEGA